MRRIVWTDEAVAHLEAIIAYISAFNPAAAARLGERLIAVADSLSEFPDRGRDAGDGGREMTTVWPYVLRYRVEGDRLVILRIRHGARDEAQALSVRMNAQPDRAGGYWDDLAVGWR